MTKVALAIWGTSREMDSIGIFKNLGTASIILAKSQGPFLQLHLKYIIVFLNFRNWFNK